LELDNSEIKRQSDPPGGCDVEYALSLLFWPVFETTGFISVILLGAWQIQAMERLDEWNFVRRGRPVPTLAQVNATLKISRLHAR
jgi:hypothetical protein